MIYFRFVINFYVKSGKATTFVLIDLILYALQISNVFFFTDMRWRKSSPVVLPSLLDKLWCFSFTQAHWGSVAILSAQEIWQLLKSWGKPSISFPLQVAIMHPLQPKESIFELKIQLYVLMVLNRKPIFNRETLLKTDEKWTRVNSNTGHYVGS